MFLDIRTIARLVLNVIPLGSLFGNLRPAHAQLYTREQQRRVGVLIAAGALIPLGLMLLKGDLLFILVAVIFLFSAELAHPVCVRQDTSHLAIGSPKRLALPADEHFAWRGLRAPSLSARLRPD